MFKSIRLRLQVWYGLMLVAVIGGFAGALYFQVRVNHMRTLDARLESAANYLQATLRALPPHEFEPNGRGPRFPRFEERRPGAPARRDRFDGDAPHHGPPPPEAFRRDEPMPDQPRPDGALSRGPRPEGPPPPGPGRPPADMPAERLRAAIALPGSLLDTADGPRTDWPYFIIWRDDGNVLAESDTPDTSSLEGQAAPRRDLEARSGFPPGFRWRPGDLRETVVAGPRGTTILVGKPVSRELAEMRWFAWRLLASGGVLLTVGLAGGWLISRSISRPIDAIALTASEISARNLARRIELGGLDQELVGLATILNEMFARLEAAFERQSRFTSDASHELRTPLAVIHAHAELALSRPRSADEYRETLAACLKAAGRMGTLVDGLLTLARADAGRLDPQFREVDWRGVVEEVVDQYRPQAAAAGIELSAALDEPLSVRGDVTLLARVSSNLLSNALRYTPSGGRVHVALSAAGHDGALLAVEDTGCGIPLEDQSKVFERFFRADKARTRSQGGNGLGLAICKSLVEAHHGSIGFTSTPDRGSRFEVRLSRMPTTAGASSRLNGPAPGDVAEAGERGP